jgi:hypothetical protein
MRRFSTIMAIVVVLFALMAQGVLAANPHFVGQVRATDLGTQLRVQGSIAGLGNENIDVEVIAQGTAVWDCRNPGGNIAPGQRTTITATGTASNLEVKNGRVNFIVTTENPAPSANACPNRSWTPILRDVEFTSFTINVYQPAGSGNLVLSRNFTV